jgi:two-component system LytT family response regulator
MKTIIIDDEEKLSELLRIKLSNHCPDVEIVDICKNVDEAFLSIKRHKPDLIFLDVAMPGGSGFTLLNRFEKIDFEIIFVTGYDDYAIDAMKVSAVDYLLKPLKVDDLKKAVQRAQNRIENKRDLEQFHILKHNLSSIEKQDAKIAIPGNQNYDFVSVNDIVRCEGEQKYTYIYLLGDKRILSSYNIGRYKDILSNYGFFTTHKSHLINIRHIDKYHMDGTLTMIDGSEVPVSRRRKEVFINEVMKNRPTLS